LLNRVANFFGDRIFLNGMSVQCLAQWALNLPEISMDNNPCSSQINTAVTIR